MAVENNSIKTFNPKAAAFIWLCHFGAAIFFYIRGEAYELAAYRWGALFIFSASLPYLLAALKKKFIFYEPVYLFLGTFLFTHTACMFLSLDEVGLDFEILTRIMQLLPLGVIAFLLGYGFGVPKQVAGKLPLSSFVIPKDRLKDLPAKLYFVGWIMRCLPFLANVISIAIPYYGYVIADGIRQTQGWQLTSIIMTNSIYAGIMLDVYLYFSGHDPELRIARRTKYLRRFLFFLILELFYVFNFAFMKEPMVVPIMLTFAMYIKTRKKIPFIPLIVGIALIVGVVMPYLEGLRHYGRNLKVGFDVCAETVFKKQYLEGELPMAQKHIIKRISNPISMSVLTYDLRRSDLKPKLYNDIFAYFALFIPRFLWPNKPIVDTNLLGKEMGIILESDGTTSVGLTLVGSFILSGGIYVVIIGMFFVGIILRTYWEWLVIRARDNVLSFIIYFLILYPWLRNGVFSRSLHSNISLLVYLYFLTRFLKR